VLAPPLSPQHYTWTWAAEHPPTAWPSGLPREDWTLPEVWPPAGCDTTDHDEPRVGATQRTLRVLQVVNGEHYAGAERVADLLAARLPQENVESGFVCVKPGRFPEERQTQAVPLWTMPMTNRFDLRPAYKLAKLLRQERFDLLHTHNPRAAMIAALAGWWAGVPLVHHVHGHTNVEMAGPSWTRANAWLERRVLRRAAAVIAVSPSVGRFLRGLGLPQPTVIPNGVPERTNLRPKFAPRVVPTLGMVALLRPRKGLEPLLEAAALLKQQGQAFKLRIIGRFETSEYEQQIHALAAHLNIGELIEWRGFRSPIQPELDELDLLIFPSVLAEGMPMVVLEALAAGVPVVASRVAGVTDIVLNNEQGLLVEPQHPEQLARAVTRVLGDQQLWRTLRENGLAHHAAKYSDTMLARQTAALYRKVLET
jgi:glycosyltransferase involved in cell wall biosynthesis